jgi:DNA-binding ferritin-like protein
MVAQHAHNLCARVVFEQDHEFFASVYQAADADYDSVIERIIGTIGEQNVPSLQEIAQAIGSQSVMPEKENSAYYKKILALEENICARIDALCKSGQISEGTKQLIGDIANRLEVEKYKIKQRVKK